MFFPDSLIEKNDRTTGTVLLMLFPDVGFCNSNLVKQRSSQMKFLSKIPYLCDPRSRWVLLVAIVVGLIGLSYAYPSVAWAWNSFGEEGRGGAKDSFYRLMRGPFGTLVMVFSGLGGFATIYMKRADRSGQGVPMIGIGLLLLAVFLFIYRIMITSGLLGSQYLDYGG